MMMSLSAGNLSSMHISKELRLSFSLLSRIKERHTINCRGPYHSSTLRTHTQCHSRSREEGVSPSVKNSSKRETHAVLDLGQIVAPRRPSLDQISANSTIARPLKSNIGQKGIIGNIMEPLELEVDSNPSRGLPDLLELDVNPSPEFPDIDSRDNEVGFQMLAENEDCETKSKTRKATRDAENFAIGILATRALTAVELRKKMHTKKFTPDIIDHVVIDLQRRGLLNDYLYAESFSRSKWSSLSWGPRPIKRALLHKGVTEADADKAIKQVFEDEDCDQVPHLGMSKPSVDHLFDQAVKQWVKGENVPIEKRKTKLVRWLQYRGFNWKVTNFVLKKLESQALLHRGVNEADADKAIKQVVEDEGCDQVPRLGMSKAAVDQIFYQAVKQWLRGENIPLEKRKARLVRWLQYRGFNWQVTNFVLKELESNYPLKV